MTETRRKLNEAIYFLKNTDHLFRLQSLDFEYHLNAFVNASRNVTWVMQKEFSRVKGFDDWWENHELKKDDELKKYVNLRNVSVKERSIRSKLFTIKHDFGPKGLRVEGKKGPTSAVSDPINFDKPIPDYGYVTVKDDHGERRIKTKIVHDFSVVEEFDQNQKVVKFENFISASKQYLDKLAKVVDECEQKFSQH